MKILFFVIALIVNCGGSFLASLLHVPLYLDSILTIGVVALSGLVPGLLCALFSNLILAFFGYAALPFTLCHILTALCAHLTFRHFRNKGEDFMTFATYITGIVENLCDKTVSAVLSFLFAQLFCKCKRRLGD